ncbi:dRaptor [Cryptococcus deuterogattii 2001/935-1]|nr:dRaptor [Cryptococcus deuterogattii 2001/935-1]
MQSSVPPATFRRINSLPPSSHSQSPTPTDNASSGWITTTSSWTSSTKDPSNTLDLLSKGGGPLAWAEVRHRVPEGGDVNIGDEEGHEAHCSQVVLLSCLYLSHEMALREVGMYAWTFPAVKDPTGSMMKIMKHPSKLSIQHHLQKARQVAGLNSYVAVIYNGHGIQEPPTESGELWCYDRSFEECLQSGGGPSEYTPVLLFDLLTWAGASTCYVWDCQNAGRFIRAAKTEAEDIDCQLRTAAAHNPSVAETQPATYAKQQIHFAACGTEQVLPKIKASGFLLSQRVLGTFKVTPESIPSIPSSTNHTLWTTWDLTLDSLFEQLPKYFDDADSNATWEKDLKLVSFVADQLESITRTGQNLLLTETPEPGMHPSLTRLPIICGASMIEEYRIQACTALDACLKLLDKLGLGRAVQGGALDVAVELLAFGDGRIKDQVISIWSSLVRYDPCVLSLAKVGLTADRLTDVPAVKFFLDTLQENLAHDELSAGSGDTSPGTQEGRSNFTLVPTVQIAAVLSTIANFVDGRSARRFVSRSLNMANIMLHSSPDLIRQWGALLIAEVLGSFNKPDDESVIEELKEELLRMVDSGNVEIRAAGVYALSRWLPVGVEWCASDLEDILQLSDHLVKQSRVEGSPLVRRELAEVFIQILKSAKGFTAIALWTQLLGYALDARPQDKSVAERTIKMLGVSLQVTPRQKLLIDRIAAILCAVCVQQYDPDPMIIKVVHQPMCRAVEMLRSQSRESKKDDTIWSEIQSVTFPYNGGLKNKPEWTDEMFETILTADKRVKELFQGTSSMNDRCEFTVEKPRYPKTAKSRKRVNHDLFKRTKGTLQAHITQAKEKTEITSHDSSAIASASFGDTWTTRHRVLEDSLVIAEQQVGLPWKWSMKDIVCPDPWATMTFHSFRSTVMSCKKGHDLLMWDWNSSRKTGHIKLNLASHAGITSARFVNELHEQIVILAEISNGDIHILAGPQDANRIRPIANFRALNMQSSRNMLVEDEDHRRLVTTWFRASGKLCVGGASEVVNVWDCPAERCVQALETKADVPVTTLITEPASGNLVLGGLADGMAQLFDLRQCQRTSVLSWKADLSGLSIPHEEMKLFDTTKHGIAKMGVTLGESKHVTSACFNGLINVHDIRNLSQPAASVLAHPNGIASASFQPHSGLMSTVSVLNKPPRNSPTGTIRGLKPGHSHSPAPSKLSAALSHLHIRSRSNLSSKTRPPYIVNDNVTLHREVASIRTSTNWSLHRTSLGTCNPVAFESISFDSQPTAVMAQDFRPYTVMHPLRLFVGIGFGKTCYLRGCGVGKGDETDSGSYAILREQAKYGVL